jgi:hypothetical protein
MSADADGMTAEEIEERLDELRDEKEQAGDWANRSPMQSRRSTTSEPTRSLTAKRRRRSNC